MAERCPDCNAPLATETRAKLHPPGCDCMTCRATCWRAWYGNRCQRPAYDWRAEALRLRARVKELEGRDAS